VFFGKKIQNATESCQTIYQYRLVIILLTSTHFYYLQLVSLGERHSTLDSKTIWPCTSTTDFVTWVADWVTKQS